jgi:hypothetical protein
LNLDRSEDIVVDVLVGEHLHEVQSRRPEASGDVVYLARVPGNPFGRRLLSLKYERNSGIDQNILQPTEVAFERRER